jgi:PAS domain S-box-containing protein
LLIERYANLAQIVIESHRARNELRIAATAFESQEGMLITDAHNVILRVNSAFTLITGYAAEEAVGKRPSILKSGRQNAEFYAAMWESIQRSGSWEGEIWNRRKNGESYPEYLTITAVKDTGGIITNLCHIQRHHCEQGGGRRDNEPGVHDPHPSAQPAASDGSAQTGIGSGREGIAVY